VLIHSRSQEDVASPTVEISSTTKSEFVGAPWTEIRDAFLALDELEIPTLETSCFLVLDAKSYEDHTVCYPYFFFVMLIAKYGELGRNLVPVDCIRGQGRRHMGGISKTRPA
jgi:hypothetical protein